MFLLSTNYIKNQDSEKPYDDEGSDDNRLAFRHLLGFTPPALCYPLSEGVAAAFQHAKQAAVSLLHKSAGGSVQQGVRTLR